MQELKWIKMLPGQNLDGGIKLLNDLRWNLTVKQMDEHWFVWGGDKTLLKTSSREAIDAFLYGMALSYAVIPDVILEQFRKHADEATQK